MKDAYQNEFQKEKKMLSLLFAICMIWFVGKFFVFGLRASWGIMKLLCTVIFFPVILIGMVIGGLDVHCFSIVDHWWHYSIGDVTFIMDQEEENE
ncbi:hypothetical protein [Faecalicatena fissicatena]|uniref:hypothetical protein n=2 Tax=Faecalicatena fissicatena TaxID=290055 RepID=UPI001FB89969|nr:hypothetical protein [Faecalicatena fissicatena]